MIRWPQQQEVLLSGGYDVYRDNRDGAVDFSARINPAMLTAWPDAAGKAGDGLGEDGLGADGYGYGGIGDGVGADGFGFDGFGAAFIEFTSPLLADGTWSFAVVASDAAGNPAAATDGTRAAVTLAGTPAPPASIAADDYDDGTDTLTLALGLSPDDEGA